MGEVYKARDTRLNRVVALKFSLEGFSDRFEREARAVAALNHPNICTLHDVGPNYLVMEFLDGTQLQGPFPPEKALAIALEIVAALEEAHSKGIIHRDLKPANIFLTRSGVKLLDFGLAKMGQEAFAMDATETQTQAGVVLGTAAYMPPEQIEGKPADARSDIFSFGAVLYELLSGQRAFSGETGAATMAAIMHKEPAPLDVAPHFQPIIARCLRKSPEDRFQSARELKAALQRVKVLAAGEHQPSIAVLPFANMSGDKENEYFSDGLAEEILNALTRVPGLKVIARTSAFAFKGKNEDIRRIAEALGVANILEGSVRRAGNRVRITAQLVTAADGSHLWSERYDREMTDVFAVQDEIALAIAGALQVKLAGRPSPVHRHLPNLPAYQAFLKGWYHYQHQRVGPEGWARARSCFEDAITLDPEYPEPHAVLGDLYLVLSVFGLRPAKEMMPLALAEARKALDLFPSEPLGHAVLGAALVLNDYNWIESREHFGCAIAADPISSEVRARYAYYYLAQVDRLREAIEEMETVLDQDPLNAYWRSMFSLLLSWAEMYDRAMAEAQMVLEIDENSWIAHWVRTEIQASRGELPEALSSAGKARQLAPWNSSVAGLLAGILNRSGKRERAEELLAELKDGPLKHSAADGMVWYHLVCSDIDAAAEWLQKAVEQRQSILITNRRCVLMKPLRASPRWPALAKMMNLPESSS
jgi:eukaryotic-like serine/threonine-protein kinase